MWGFDQGNPYLPGLPNLSNQSRLLDCHKKPLCRKGFRFSGRKNRCAATVSASRQGKPKNPCLHCVFSGGRVKVLVTEGMFSGAEN
jgi:hypothetical protein